LIAGLIKPVTGQVLVDNSDINASDYDRNVLRQRVGVVFQYPECQLFETTVERDVAFGLKHFGWSQEKVGQAVKEALEMVGFNYDEVKDLSPYFINSLYAVDRACAWHTKLKPFYESGKTLLFDRYTTSSLIYQAAMIEDIEERKEFLDILFINKPNFCNYEEMLLRSFGTGALYFCSSSVSADR
jgi:hypothetical protein